MPDGFNFTYVSKPEIGKIFSQSHLNDTTGFVLREGTRPSDNYSANNVLTCGYLGLYAPVNSWILSAGARLEANNQQVNSTDNTSNNATNSNLVKNNVFPSANATYNFSESKLLRIGYFESINRPAFRELASFNYYDYFSNINIVGNPNLQNCTISNLDIRYDYYPTREDIVTAGVFFKNFRNPIERVISKDSLQFTFANATSAYSAGIELEARRSLSDLSNNEFLKHCTLVANASAVLSGVKLGGANISGLDYDNRSLMGQAPWMFNGGIFYSDAKGHTTFNLMYNVFGPRVYSVGNALYPTQYELTRHVVDLNVNKYVSSDFEFRISLQDILSSSYRIWQDTDRDGTIDTSKGSKDRAISSYRRGQWFNFTATYKFH
jgi:outer membrane receptor for Fe3+-dicitrate